MYHPEHRPACAATLQANEDHTPIEVEIFDTYSE